jgi:hypothetical protein
LQHIFKDVEASMVSAGIPSKRLMISGTTVKKLGLLEKDEWIKQLNEDNKILSVENLY